MKSTITIVNMRWWHTLSIVCISFILFLQVVINLVYGVPLNDGAAQLLIDSYVYYFKLYVGIFKHMPAETKTLWRGYNNQPGHHTY